MTAPSSARALSHGFPADISLGLASGAYFLARSTEGRLCGAGLALFVFAAAHAALFTLFLGETLLRRIAG
jgi:hypothetical protein